MNQYRIEYKLRHKRTGTTGETHTTYMRAESETNAINELAKQNPSYDIVVLSLRKQ
jgi:hypothetical protein